MLFRSLIDRLLGSNESFDDASDNVARSRLSYDRYPGLMNMVWQLLRDSLSQQMVSESVRSGANEEMATHEALFPILDLLRRAPPVTADREELRPYILKAAGTAQWHIRDIASRTYATLYEPLAFLENVAILAPSVILRHNETHGRLLCLGALLKSHFRKKHPQLQCSNVAKWLRAELLSATACNDGGYSSGSLFVSVFMSNTCPVMRGAYLGVVNEVGKYVLKADGKRRGLMVHFLS